MNSRGSISSPANSCVTETGMLRASSMTPSHGHGSGGDSKARDALNCRFCIELAGAAADRGTPRETAASSPSGDSKSRPYEMRNNAQRTFGAAARCW